MSTTRPKLNMVDDPVARRPAQAPPTSSEAPAPPKRVGSAPAPATAAAAAVDSPDVAATTPPTPVQAPSRPAQRLEPEGFGQEPKKAVFGRVPRSLSRRLERAVLELREHSDDLTQEQVLAALLDKYVDPTDPESLTALTEIVNDYRSRL